MTRDIPCKRGPHERQTQVLKNPQIVVLGGGPGGLCAAWNLAQDGYQVTVFEKELVCGGQSITFERDGYRYDLGPHNIHPQRRSIIDFLKRNLGAEFIQHNFHSQILFQGRRINYPFVGVDILRSLDAMTLATCGLSYLYSRFRAAFLPFAQDDGTFQTWIVNRFGRRFYDIFFGPYSEKVWGMPADQLSDVVAKKRIVVSSIADLVHALFSNKEKYHPENPRVLENYYPQQGVGAISDFFVAGIEGAGGKIIRGAKISRLVQSDGMIRAIEFDRCGQHERLEFDRAAGGRVLSTIPLNEMVLLIEGDVPEDIKSAARGLDFSSEVFLYINVNKPDILRVPVLYFSDSEFRFNRIYDVGIFSRKMVPPGKNAICLEITCTKGDSLWNMPDEELFELCLKPLERNGLLRRLDVEGYHTRRLTHAYPRFRVGYQEKLNAIFRYLSTISNLSTFGRQGLFSYANVDDVLWMGFEVSKNIHYRDRLHLSIEELLPQYVPFY
jgi:protoporphyrinogen oxidase